jgi:hypothetical protein
MEGVSERSGNNDRDDAIKKGPEGPFVDHNSLVSRISAAASN